MDEKTFTQEEVNKIVSKRLSEERAKMEKEFSAKALHEKARGILKEKGYNPDLADVLNFNDEETLNKSIELLGGNERNRQQRPNYSPNNGGGIETKTDSIRKAFGLPQGRNYGAEFEKNGWIDNMNLSTVYRGSITPEESIQQNRKLEEKYKSWMEDNK